MNSRFKQLENAVYNDMIAHIDRTGGISDFKPKYTARITRSQHPAPSTRRIAAQGEGVHAAFRPEEFATESGLRLLEASGRRKGAASALMYLRARG